MKKLILFVIAYFIITMAWAYPWHVLWFHEQYASWGAITREHPIMPFGIAAILIQGVAIAWLYPFYIKETGSTLLRGVRFNLIIGLMTYTAMSFATAAKIKIDPAWVFIAYHTVFQLIQFTLTGLALGWIYKKY